MKDNYKKEFKWQYSDEKLLIKRHENLLSFILRKSHVIIVYIVLSTISFFVLNYMYSSYFISFIFSLLILLLIVVYLSIQFKNSWMIITSRRVLKVIKSSLFIEHRRELKLEDIKATLVRKNITNALFWYWKIEIQWTDEHSNIYFEWIKWHVNIVNYLSRIIDYIKINGHWAELKKYVDNKYR